MLLRLKYLRERENFTQQELAKKIDIAASNISKYENGLLEPNINILIKYSRFFNVSIDFIIGESAVEQILPTSAFSRSFVYLIGRFGVANQIDVPEELAPRLLGLLQYGIPELFKEDDLK